ncbi:E3 ubiquitin-protein ligase TRIM11-like [Ambystoma mexicanum]|uniref:E3 ubiquitin-protein ligase TRIM11-like n=1 Tax=Ambystoma mexicanum TaxID=8296 RepID=UPI0037E85012
MHRPAEGRGDSPRRTMAAPVADLQNEVTCSVCLEYFTDPVTIECGHSYCRACITLTWERAGGAEAATCPQCRKACRKTDLSRNLQLANLVEITQKFASQLVDGDLCEQHDEKLKLFCEEDQRAVCTICDRSREHRGHTVIPIQEAVEQYQLEFSTTLVNLRKEMDNILRLTANKTQRLTEFKITTQSERRRIEGEFEELHRFLEEEKRSLLSKLQTEEQNILQKLNEAVTRLSDESAALNKLMIEIEKKRHLSSVQLLKDVKSFLNRCKSETVTATEDVFSTELSNSVCSFSKDHVVTKMLGKYRGFTDVYSICPEMEELRVLLLDLTGPGGSAAGNCSLGAERCAKMVNSECKRGGSVRNGRKVVVIDVQLPPENGDAEKEIGKAFCLSLPGPHAIVLVLKVGQSFSEVEERVAGIKELFANHPENHMIIVFLGEELLGNKSMSQYVQESEAQLKELIKKCGNRYCAFSSGAPRGEQEQQVSVFFTMVDRMLQDQGGAFHTSEEWGYMEKILLDTEASIKVQYSEEKQSEEKEIKSQCEALIKDLGQEKDSPEKDKLVAQVIREMKRKLQESGQKHETKVEGARDGIKFFFFHAILKAIQATENQ